MSRLIQRHPFTVGWTAALAVAAIVYELVMAATL
jgi:hypothetical protein